MPRCPSLRPSHSPGSFFGNPVCYGTGSICVVVLLGIVECGGPLPFRFLRERSKSGRTHSNRVSAPHSAHAPMAHLHGTIERGLSRSCGLPAELQDSFLGER